MSNSRKKFRIGLGVLVLGCIFLYGLFQARNLIQGPIVVVTQPQNGATLPDEMLTVEGYARNIAYIKLNDRQIFVDDRGFFSEKLIAPSGYSIMKIWAEDKFGKTEEQFIHLFLASSSLPTLPITEPLEEKTPEEGESEENATNTKNTL
jgi:hypothetical protein